MHPRGTEANGVPLTSLVPILEESALSGHRPR